MYARCCRDANASVGPGLWLICLFPWYPELLAIPPKRRVPAAPRPCRSASRCHSASSASASRLTTPTPRWVWRRRPVPSHPHQPGPTRPEAAAHTPRRRTTRGSRPCHAAAAALPVHPQPASPRSALHLAQSLHNGRRLSEKLTRTCVTLPPAAAAGPQSVINKFTGFVESGKVDLICNTSVGKDVSVAELRQLYHVVRFFSSDIICRCAFTP